MNKEQARKALEEATKRFMEQGGSINKLNTKQVIKRKPREMYKPPEVIDLSVLPAALKIRYGYRDEA